jgi:hypothetical protein
MTAVIYHFAREGEAEPTDETERLLDALRRYSSAELLELLYVGEEHGFFELIRGLFALPDESRLILQEFLTNSAGRPVAVEMDQEGRCILASAAAPDQDSQAPSIVGPRD